MLPDALIFDVDGTLAETEEAHRRAFNAVFAEAGLDWVWDQPLYTRLLAVTGGKERIRHWCETIRQPLDEDAVAALHSAKNARYAEALAAGEVALRPGVAALIEAAEAAGVRLAVASTTSRPNLDALIEATLNRPSERVFEVIACGDDVPEKKPHPAIYHLALARLGLAGERCIALEDSSNGVRAAVGAGLPCLVTPGVYTAKDDFTGAVVVDTLEGLTPADVMSRAAHGERV